MTSSRSAGDGTRRRVGARDGVAAPHAIARFSQTIVVDLGGMLEAAITKRTRVSFIGLFALAVFTAGCQGGGRDQQHAAQAKEEFSKANSCPAPSVTVETRHDLSAYDLQVTPPAPPAEVAADPARLAEWKRRQDESRKGYENMTVQLASGCGHTVYYTCSPATSTNDQQVIACSVAQHPPK